MVIDTEIESNAEVSFQKYCLCMSILLMCSLLITAWLVDHIKLDLEKV